MFQSLIRNSVVQLFGLLAKLGLHHLPAFNRVFLAFYAIYKQYFEAGPTAEMITTDRMSRLYGRPVEVRREDGRTLVWMSSEHGLPQVGEERR